VVVMSGFPVLDVGLFVPQVSVPGNTESGSSSRRHRSVNGHFLRGPIMLSWLGRACGLPGRAPLAMALALHFVAGIQGRKEGLRVSMDKLPMFGLNRSSKKRALEALEGAGLVRLHYDGQRSTMVTLLDVQPCGRFFLSGPITLSWLGRACKLPGKALAMALACWYVAGLRSRKGGLKVTTNTLAQFGLDRISKARGLKALEKAGLVCLNRDGQKSPSVTIAA
jgi:DNA-binding transcriptional ArsR family regulator